MKRVGKEALEPVLAGAAQRLPASPDPRERDLEERLTRRLVRQLERLEQQVTLEPATAEAR